MYQGLLSPLWLAIALAAGGLGFFGTRWLAAIQCRDRAPDKWLLSWEPPPASSNSLTTAVFYFLSVSGLLALVAHVLLGNLVIGFVAVSLVLPSLTSWAFAQSLRIALRDMVGTLELPNERTMVITIVGEDRTHTVALAPQSIEAWAIGDGHLRPVLLQLVVDAGGDRGPFCLVVAPATRHFRLATPTLWGPNVRGPMPLTRSEALIDRLAPFMRPGGQPRSYPI